MAFENHIVDRLSTRLSSLLPEHIKDDAPIFEMFLEAYFEYLESEIIVLSSKGELTGIRLEDGTSETAAAVLLELVPFFLLQMQTHLNSYKRVK